MALPRESEAILNEAEYQRDEYFSNEDLILALQIVEEKGVLSEPRKALNQVIGDFLHPRRIEPKAEFVPRESLETLVRTDPQKGRLLGEAFHFARKGFTTMYDQGAGESKIIDPIPLIRNVFNALNVFIDHYKFESVDHQHAANFLDNLCEDLRKPQDVKPTQHIVMDVIKEILPALNFYYESQLASLKTKFDQSSPTYKSKMADLASQHRQHLNMLVAYTRMLTDEGRKPSFGEFWEYVGQPSDASGNGGSSKKRVEVTRGYLASLFSNGRSYTDAITRLESEVGPLVRVDWSANHERSTGRVILYIGVPENPTRVSVVYAKRNTGGNEKGFLDALCDHIGSKSGLPAQFKSMTKTAKASMKVYLGGK